MMMLHFKVATPFFCPRNMFNDAVHINQIDCDLRNKKNDDDVETY